MNAVSRRRGSALIVVVVSMLALALAAPAYAAGPYPGLTDLSAAKKSKLSPRLYTLTRDPLSGASANAQADGVDLPRAGAGSLVRSDAGALMVYVRVADRPTPRSASSVRRAWLRRTCRIATGS